MDELITYGSGDVTDWAPVAKQYLKKDAMSVADLCAAAVELSDNTCANAVLARFGCPPAPAAKRTGAANPLTAGRPNRAQAQSRARN
jgi:beta-lactamase class A